MIPRVTPLLWLSWFLLSLSAVVLLLAWADTVQAAVEGYDSLSSSIDDSNQEGDGAGCGCGTGKLSRDAVYSSDSGSLTDHIVERRLDSKDDPSESLSIQERLNKKMVFIPGGKTFIGTNSPILRKDGEAPRRSVTLSPYFMDIYEVSNEDFNEFVQSTGYITESETFGWSFVFHLAIPESTMKEIKQAVLGAEWWLPVNGKPSLHVMSLMMLSAMINNFYLLKHQGLTGNNPKDLALMSL